MAKLTAPLMSLGARGTIGKTIVFAAWKGIEFARRHVIPANPQTTEQSETRNVFTTLNGMFKVAQTLARASWVAGAQGKPLTDRNYFIKSNLPGLRGQADMTAFVGSPGALAGLPPASVSAAFNVDHIEISLVAPTLPPGWTIQGATGIAFPDQDPSDPFGGPLDEDEDLVTPYLVTLPAGPASGTWICSGWFRYTRPDGRLAYGPSLQDTVVVP